MHNVILLMSADDVLREKEDIEEVKQMRNDIDTALKYDSYALINKTLTKAQQLIMRINLTENLRDKLQANLHMFNSDQRNEANQNLCVVGSPTQYLPDIEELEMVEDRTRALLKGVIHESRLDIADILNK